MAYVDGFLLAVPKAKLPSYRRIARRAGKIWREHGALEFRECVADDLKAGDFIPFTRTIRVEPGETVVFSWIVFRSRAHRDRVNAKVTKDPRITSMDPASMPVSRMAYGGFKVLVDLASPGDRAGRGRWLSL